MNLQQLRSVREAARRGFNLTEVARALHTSQPGVSRQIRELEQELGFELFVRAGKRLTSLTQAGAVALPVIEGILAGAENLLRVGEEYAPPVGRQAEHCRHPFAGALRAARCGARFPAPLSGRAAGAASGFAPAGGGNAAQR